MPLKRKRKKFGLSQRMEMAGDLIVAAHDAEGSLIRCGDKRTAERLGRAIAALTEAAPKDESLTFYERAAEFLVGSK